MSQSHLLISDGAVLVVLRHLDLGVVLEVHVGPHLHQVRLGPALLHRLRVGHVEEADGRVDGHGELPPVGVHVRAGHDGQIGLQDPVDEAGAGGEEDDARRGHHGHEDAVNGRARPAHAAACHGSG